MVIVSGGASSCCVGTGSADVRGEGVGGGLRRVSPLRLNGLPSILTLFIKVKNFTVLHDNNILIDTLIRYSSAYD